MNTNETSLSWSDGETIRRIIMERARSSAPTGEVWTVNNLSITSNGLGTAEARSYELQMLQRPGARIESKGVVFRLDRLAADHRGWRVVESDEDAFLGHPTLTGDEGGPADETDAKAFTMDWHDHAAIESLNLAYARLIDNGDYEGLARLFERGSWNGLQGFGEVLGWLTANLPRPFNGRPGTLHAISNLVLDVNDDGASATGSSTQTIYRSTVNSIEPYIVNDYEDVYRRGPQGWYFADRRIIRRMRVD